MQKAATTHTKLTTLLLKNTTSNIPQSPLQ
jgi:hypothetical protein